MKNEIKAVTIYTQKQTDFATQYHILSGLQKNKLITD